MESLEQVANRLMWLRALGAVIRIGMEYNLTDYGRRFAESLEAAAAIKVVPSEAWEKQYLTARRSK
ncbi:MAG: hypothetical protein QXG48_02625 [Thermofilaceae archaeon]